MGGVGLNLQNASAVINMDQPWNPAVLEQRIGRVHRLGQHKPVKVIHFISQGTIEKATVSIPEQMPKRMALPVDVAETQKTTRAEISKVPDDTNEAWSEVLTSGMSFLQKIGKVLSSGGEKKSPVIVRDNEGKAYFRIPLPENNQLQQIVQLISNMAQNQEKN